MKPLKRKLATVFVALGLVGLLVVGVTSYTVVQWRESEDEQRRHYTRSLRLQEVRALSFEAFKEVPDAVIGNDADAREDYEQRRAPIAAAFEEWASLAEDDDERAEVQQVRAAAGELDRNAQMVFDLVEDGRRDEAVRVLEQVEERVFEPFDALTSKAVASDRDKRDVVRSEAAGARRTATLTLTVAALGVVSLLLLVGAYLIGGVFNPIRRLTVSVRRMAAGETDVDLGTDVDGDDEIAELNRELARLSDRLRAGTPAGPGAEAPDAVADAQLMLTRMVDGVHDEALALRRSLSRPADVEAGTALVARIEATRIAITRLGALAHPVDLDLTPVDPLALLHDVMDRVNDHVIRHHVSTRIDISDGIEVPLLDRARIRETLSELVRNSLDALPERGGHLHLRARPADDGAIVFEVEDDGPGVTEDDVSWLYDGSDRPSDARGVGLRLAASIVEQHGGRLQLESRAHHGTIARIVLPRTDHRQPHHTEKDRS